MLHFWWIPVLLGVLILSVLIFGPSWYRRWQRARVRHARAQFSLRREWLEARFLALAARSGKPRGLEWVDCEFDSGVRFARDRDSGQLRALVGVTISFEATVGGGMEDVEAVGNLRAATAVFKCEDGVWSTEGRAIFNLSPEQAIKHFEHELELVE
jgi:hypothetical protein